VKSLAARIRAKAATKERVVITRRKRSQHGFLVTGPDGSFESFPTKAQALSNLFARVRCSQVRCWHLTIRQTPF